MGRGGVPLPTLPPRGGGPLFGGAGPTGGNAAYPDGSNAPNVRYATGYNVMAPSTKPPYTTLTAYDLNRGTIRWQIGLGDDLRLIGQGVTGTGTAATTKGGIIPTATGLLFVTAADRKVHVYDSATGKQVSELSLGGATSGSPAMYELGGRQYLLVTASPAGGAGGGRRGPGPSGPPATGPTGIVAYALPR